MNLDDRNYLNDSRVRAANASKWYTRLDARRMCAIVVLENEDGEEVEHTVSYTFAVCPTCEGQGTHVNPSIDASGLTASDLAEWDDEDHESYRGGAYDVPCYECAGQRVVPEMDRSKVSPELLEQLDAAASDDAAYEAECRAERMMGA